MPGITGIISKTSPLKNQQDLSSMINTMLHEPFYSHGTYNNENLGTYAGWVCHKDSFCDCMPVWNEKKDIALIFFGETFTELELFDQLKAKHHRFDKSNATYLIHVYEEKGIDFLQELNGWFSGILIDRQANKTILFNDRFGMQKIFYYEGKEAFYFASEAKAILNVCPELRQLDMQGLGELLNCGCTLERRTLFKNVFLLPPASAWSFNNSDRVNRATYFNPASWENQTWLEKEFFYDKLRETFVHILPRYFRSTQTIGISLTGGLDTRMLLANMDMPEYKYPFYTFGSMYRKCFDEKVAQKVAASMNQTHYIIKLDSKFLFDFPKYAERTIYVTDGSFDVSGAPELYVNKLAREIAPIRLTGNYGSEVLRDIRWLKAGRPNEDAFSPDFRVIINSASNTLVQINQIVSNPLTFTLFVETPWHENNRLVSEQSQLTLRTPYLDNDIVKLLYRAPMGVRDSRELSWRLISDGNPALAAIPTDRGYGGNLRFPLSTLSRMYYEFLFKTEYAYNYGMPQWLARFDYTFKFIHFERLFLGRHKFYHFRLWYRDQLADYVKAILLDDRTLNRPYLNKKAVEQMVGSHTKGYRNYTTEITQLLSIELIQRLLIEKQTS